MTTFEGQTYRPGDCGYDEHRMALRADLDPRPALIVQAAGAADIRTAILLARETGLRLAVQATGHGTHQAADGALLVKTTDLASVLVDPDRRIAKVGPGATWGQVLKATAPLGLAPLSGSSPTVGVTGFSLGGGMGWLSRKHGFAADSITRAKVVTADGRLIVASAGEYPDLFWALRGGGANFGVVVGLEFKLYPVAPVLAGTVTIAGDLTENLVAYRDWALTLPNETSTAAVVKDSSLMIKVMHSGEDEVAPFWTQPIENNLRRMAYADASMGGTAARHFEYYQELSREAIANAVENHDENGSTVEIRHWAGAISKPGGAAGHRDMTFSVILDNPNVKHTDGTKAFLNFTSDPQRTELAFTPANYRRLREVKRFYDPDNFFRLNHNIAPAAALTRTVRSRSQKFAGLAGR